MKNIITLFTLLMSLSTFAQNQTESWYKIGNERFSGYFHYAIQEDSISINTSLNFKFKIEKDLLYYDAKLINSKDSFLTVKSFFIKGTTDDLPNPDEFTISGTVDSTEEFLSWKVDGDKEFKTKQATIADWNLFYVLTTLDYSKKGIILEFNSIEISELNYEENRYLEYVADERILINNKEVLAKKITNTGEGIVGSTYWLDAENRLVKISIDNRKNYILCNKEDIDFEKYK